MSHGLATATVQLGVQAPSRSFCLRLCSLICVTTRFRNHSAEGAGRGGVRGRVSGTLLHYVVLLIVISSQEVETIAHHVGGIGRGVHKGLKGGFVS